MDKISAIQNVDVADEKARLHKTNKFGVIKHDKNREEENKLLSETLALGTYKTSEYKTFKIYEPKERLIFRLPYYPDRITHHAIINILEPIWTNTFISSTYSCIKGRGIKGAYEGIKKSLKDVKNTTYCLKVDIKKFYPSLNHEILFKILKRKIKDNALLNLLWEIIESNEKGVPIGNYLSQFFANLYLTPLDHKIKEVWKVKHYHRYADDMVFLHSSKEFLHHILELLKEALAELKLELKGNYQIFAVEDRGIDFVGFVFRHGYILLRKSIKAKITRLMFDLKHNLLSPEKFKTSMSAYYGWLQMCNAKHLMTKIRDLTGVNLIGWLGKKTIISKFYNHNIRVVVIDERPKYYKVNVIYKDKPYSFKSTAKLFGKYKECRNFNLYLKAA